MLIRKLEDNTVVVISLDYTDEQEQQFLDANPTGGFSVVSGLPHSLYSKWKEVDGVVVVDNEAEAKVTQDNENANNRAYLASTDWYDIRAAATGVPTPQDILDKRAAAREAIV